MFLHVTMKAARLLLPAACLLWITGCWSRVEINDRAFVSGMYVDVSEESGYEVSLGFPLSNRLSSGGSMPSGGASDGNPYAIVSKRAGSIPEAIRKIRSDLSREISWGHCRIIIVGTKMAESGVDPILEFVTREPNFHTKSYFLVAPGKGKDITELTPVFERLPSEVLREFAERKVTLDTSVKDLLEAAARGGDAAAALLTIGKVKMVSEKGKLSTWVGTDGAALFKNGKMVGTFNVQEMRAALWIDGKMKSSVISLKSPTDGKTISFLILNSKSQIKPVVSGDRIRFDIRIEAEDDVMSSESDIDLNDPEQISKIENLLSQQLKGRIMSAIQKTQQMGIDVFAFGRYIEWRYPKVWYEHQDHWRSTYKNCEFSVVTQVSVKRTGVEKNPIVRQMQRQQGGSR
ncbi:Ger(x)C family spore germination protein [Paenibacillus validus]|uniref:Ger(x)C family spore germination protein n=1 Tax=Paenibacillus validus TaxID=44253 RepID=UPI000FD7C2A5|nr:Ger(x)C family spore germination protein [Paenibacillus validus]MED4602809.1 Ger(x)C family spore germination protein [Paenibacillus validus]MED4607349.1 Ger(x)C family spore germination protein [Paenibacillus validus]